MPGMGGEELAEIAVTLRPGIRVVFTSAFQTPPGDAAFVPTPYGAVDLIRALPPQPLPSLEILISDKLASDPPLKDHSDIGCPEDLNTSSHP